jgi:hypothetical protein
MTKNRALLSLALFAAPCLSAAAQPAAAPAPSADVIVPLNARDPSALVMGPVPGSPKYPIVEAPARRPAAGGESARASKSSFDKAGPSAGKRSVGVPVEESQLLSVKVGDHVDVLAVFDAVNAEGVKEKFAATMLQNVRVLGVTTTGDLRGAGVLTLELNPNEAQFAQLGLRLADLGVSVRAPGDVEIYPMEMAAFHRFFR